MEQIKDDHLLNFLFWYKNHYSKSQTFQAGLSVSMAGHFHTTPKVAKALLLRCERLGYVSIQRECVKINVGL
jgi:hypothetical protein